MASVGPSAPTAVTTAPAIPRSSLAPRDPERSFKFASLVNGCWSLAGGHGVAVFDQIEEKLTAHAKAGYTTFDTADVYGPSEQILGGFSRSWREAGNAPVQLFTQYAPFASQTSQPSPALTEAAIRRSLRNLQTDSLDLVQLHWWDYGVPGMTDTALYLADLQSKGLIKQVGLMNMNIDGVVSVVEAGVQVDSNQVQFSLLDRRPLNGMIQFCQPLGIQLLTYGSVAGGLLSDKHVVKVNPSGDRVGKARFPPVERNTSSLKMYWKVVKQFGEGGGQELWRELLGVLASIAEKHQVSVANVALRWVIQQGESGSGAGNSIVHPIVGLRSIDHIEDNARVFSFALDATDLEAIGQVLARAKGPKGDCYSFERGEKS